jgi:hypothetical protein
MIGKFREFVQKDIEGKKNILDREQAELDVLLKKATV